MFLIFAKNILKKYKKNFIILYMNRIYCIIGKMVEVTQNIELDISDIIEKSEIIKEFSRHQVMSKETYDQVVDDAKYLKPTIIHQQGFAENTLIYCVVLNQQ